MSGRRYWVWVFGEIEGLRWVLRHNRMAFAESVGVKVAKMNKGDRAVLYVSRGAFRNPNKAETRVVGVVRITGIRSGIRPITVGGREYSRFIDFEPELVLGERTGPPVKPMVQKLEIVGRQDVWGVYFQNSPIEISKRDFEVLASAVESWKGG